ncbi:hypothetical protein BV20DRAFT_962355 [Pilatotrama ljubarskyi]|nr:hypothetical protein BV20DRAFT_962355 [Pilatotrama ljubarskyi]
MPSSSAKQTARRKAAKRHQPYDNSKRQQTHARSVRSTISASTTSSTIASASSSTTSTTSSLPSSSPAPISPLLATRPSRAPHTIRDLSLRVIRNKYPYFTPRNDWDILFLSSGPYTGPPQDIYKYLDSQLAADLRYCSYETTMEQTRKTLDKVVDVTGLKPEPGDPHVFVHPIPNSKYSIRLFPGSAKGQDYCLDFLLTETGEPVNSPFEFDLLCIPDPNVPVPSGPIVRMRPLECSFGIRQDKINPGEEKFLLRDGQHCVLRRPGHRDVRFTVPIRRRPKAVTQPADADYIHFPQYID